LKIDRFSIFGQYFLEVESEGDFILRASIIISPTNIEKFEESKLPTQIAEFFEKYREHSGTVLPDTLFMFNEKTEKYRQILLYLKNNVLSGDSISYKNLGKIFGFHPRVVGMIVAKNPFHLIIPCHRVVGSDNSLSGYSAEGGLNTKKAFLDFERQTGVFG